MGNKHEIQSIKFYAKIPKPGGESEAKGTFFGVGEGQGHKVINSLSVTLGPSYIVVHQKTSDGEAKSFLYKFDDIVGRVEIVDLHS